MKIVYICSPDFLDDAVERVERAYLAFVSLDGKRKAGESGSAVVTITCYKDYSKYDFRKKPDYVLIESALDWADKPGNHVYYGYEIAFDLMKHRLAGQIFDLQFVTNHSRGRLLEYVSPERQKFLTTFRHNDPDTPLLFGAPCSDIHFDLIRKMNTEDITRLKVIRHHLVSLKSQAEMDHHSLGHRASRLVKSVLQEFKDLHTLRGISKPRLAEIGADLAPQMDIQKLGYVIGRLIDLIGEAERSEQSGEDISGREKRLFKALVLEDEPHWLQEISQVLRTVFQTVIPSKPAEFTGYDVSYYWKKIREFKNINLFVIDLMYMDQEENYLNFNGLDIYQAIRRAHPYAVIRIISSLPRDLIAGLIEKHQLDISFKEFISKRDGLRAVRAILVDRADDLIAECAAMEKRKTAFYPFPRQGIFGWPGVQTFLFDLASEQPAEYRAYWERTLQIFKKIRSGKEIDLAADWDNGDLPSPHKTYTFDEDYIKNKLVGLFVHRLLLIDYALSQDRQEVNLVNYYEDVLQKYRQGKTMDTNYLNKIGIEKRNIDKENFALLFKNLFAFEYQHVAEKFNAADPSSAQTLVNKNNQISIWFKEILSAPEIYENWHVLQLDFSPYERGVFTYDERKERPDAKPLKFVQGNFKEAISELTLRDIQNFLQCLINRAAQDEVQLMIEVMRQKKNNLVPKRNGPTAVYALCQAFSR